MTDAAQLLAPERVRCKETIGSKKRALDLGAELLAAAAPGMSQVDIFNALNTRERLGSTGLGHGTALPHGRLENLESPVAACLTLAEPVDFDAPDRQRVDVLFVLLVPRDCSSEHLRILAELAEMFNDPNLRDALRAQTEPAAIIECLREWAPVTGDRVHGLG
ncbi:MAG: PTS sugar transporter subunit IIA [Halofilum sp. (in: g-proteobacteria)]